MTLAIRDEFALHIFANEVDKCVRLRNSENAKHNRSKGMKRR